MKKWIKSLFPSLGHYIWRWRNEKISKTAKCFSDGIIFYGMQDEAYEPEVMNILRREAQHYKYFVNLGANAGFFAIRLARYFDRVVAVEALAENANLLAQNIYENNLSEKCTLFNSAAGTKFEVLRFFGAGTGGSLVAGWNSQSMQSAFVQSVPGDFIHESCLGKESSALYLIDCEGAEYSVLCGLENVIKNTNSSFLVEVPCREFMPGNIFNPNFKKVFALMARAGYQSFHLNVDGDLVSLSDRTIDGMIESDRFHGLMVLFKKVECE